MLTQEKTMQKGQLQFHERTMVHFVQKENLVSFVKSSFIHGRQYFCLTDWLAVIMQLKILLAEQLVEIIYNKISLKILKT